MFVDESVMMMMMMMRRSRCGPPRVLLQVTGNTIFNVLQMAERPVDDNDRPEEDIRIRKTETLSCPFDDIVCRDTSAKQKSESDASEAKKRKRKVKGTKNFSLISFGDEAAEVSGLRRHSTD